MTNRLSRLARAARLSAPLVLGGMALPFGISAANAQDAKPAPDKTSIWTLQGENASISTAKLTDRFYTNGVRVGWTSGVGEVPDFLQRMGRALWFGGDQRISFDLTQQIYTPANTSTAASLPGDRPYAGVLMANFSLMQDTPTTRSSMTLGLGVVGPAALGEEVQNNFHDLIGQKRINGWSSQLHNEPLLQITSERVWRVKTGHVAGLETEALPSLTAAVGNLRVYGQTGVVFRIGEGLESDFGPARLRPGLTGGDAYTPTRPFAWYIFAGAGGQAVAHDITLDGNTWRTSPNVKRELFVGEVQAGFAIMYHGVRLTYTHVIQTEQYHHQPGGLHQFGSLAASVRF
ncbi:MAG: hypothetical protein BGP12_14030 [Rhodospirillales bacterium 70-18]|nr:lipid A deacylase LpxR family protein [Rhodospirillales bacterium]OJY73694.1 MAG: hypothetical protein BGP12_14030 [Rhodospirillales bacterium 70-18]